MLNKTIEEYEMPNLLNKPVFCVVLIIPLLHYFFKGLRAVKVRGEQLAGFMGDEAALSHLPTLVSGNGASME